MSSDGILQIVISIGIKMDTKLETTSTGVTVTGTVTADLVKLNPTGGVSEGGQIEFQRAVDDQTAWYVDVNGSGTDTSLRFVDNDDTNNPVTRVSMNNTGVYVTGTVTASEGVLIPEGKKLRLGSETDSAGLDIYESTDGDSLINQYGDGNLIVKGQNILLRNNSDQTLISTIANTAQLFHRNGDNEGLKLETTNSGIDVTGTVTADGVKLGDNDKLQFGDVTTPDLEIFHDGINSRITDQGTGSLIITGEGHRLCQQMWENSINEQLNKH